MTGLDLVHPGREVLERDDGRSLAFPMIVARRKTEVTIGPHSTEFRL